MDSSNSSFLLSEEAIIEPTGTIVNADEEKITEMGKNILILVISSCHVLATFILFCGIRGKYSKVEKRDIENLDSDTNLKTQLETIKDALRRMLIQTRLRKQVCFSRNFTGIRVTWTDTCIWSYPWTNIYFSFWLHRLQSIRQQFSVLSKQISRDISSNHALEFQTFHLSWSHMVLVSGTLSPCSVKSSL